MTWHFFSTCLNSMCFSKLNQRNKQSSSVGPCHFFPTNPAKINKWVQVNEQKNNNSKASPFRRDMVFLHISTSHLQHSTVLRLLLFFRFHNSHIADINLEYLRDIHPLFSATHISGYVGDDRPKHSMCGIFTCTNDSFFMVN